MSVGTQIKAATDRRKERRAARVAKKTRRQNLRKEIKGHRQNKDLTKVQKRGLIGASRAMHKGGMAGVGKYSQKMTARKKKRDDRKAARTARKAAKVTRKEQRTSWKEKRGTVSKADRSFHQMAAKQKQMKEYEYYNQYVK
jgi:hypothetical protein